MYAIGLRLVIVIIMRKYDRGNWLPKNERKYDRLSKMTILTTYESMEIDIKMIKIDSTKMTISDICQV